MPSQSGKVYGLTLLCPILDDPMAIPSHDLQIRGHLAELPTGPDSPFAIAPGTHLARLVVLDDVIYVGMPAREDHLKSKYLVFESNCDGTPILAAWQIRSPMSWITSGNIALVIHPAVQGTAALSWLT
jgi:hypothetical protein